MMSFQRGQGTAKPHSWILLLFRMIHHGSRTEIQVLNHTSPAEILYRSFLPFFHLPYGSSCSLHLKNSAVANMQQSEGKFTRWDSSKTYQILCPDHCLGSMQNPIKTKSNPTHLIFSHCRYWWTDGNTLSELQSLNMAVMHLLWKLHYCDEILRANRAGKPCSNENTSLWATQAAVHAAGLCGGQGSPAKSSLGWSSAQDRGLSCVSELTIMGPPSGALPSSPQSLHLKVKASKKLDSSCQLQPVSFLPVPSNEQFFFFLMWQWMALWCFLVFIINLWPSFFITRYQLLLPSTPSPHPWELMAKATFS